MKYKVDQWVIYIPFPNDEIESLAKIKKMAVILNILPRDDFYDYEIFIDGEGKIKKKLVNINFFRYLNLRISRDGTQNYQKTAFVGV